MRAIRLDFPDVEVIVITGRGDLDSATDAIRHGICDYLQKPFDVVQVTAAVYRALSRRRGRRRLVSFLEELGEIVGRDVHVADILDQLETDAGLRNRLGAVLARSAADFAPPPAIEPERTLPFFEVLADAIESQDPSMRGHARRTAFYATLLAERLCLSETEKRQVRLATFLHDVGKIGVPSALLAQRRPARIGRPPRRRTTSRGGRAPDRAARRLRRTRRGRASSPRALGRSGLSRSARRRSDPAHGAHRPDRRRIRRHDRRLATRSSEMLAGRSDLQNSRAARARSSIPRW